MERQHMATSIPRDGQVWRESTRLTTTLEEARIPQTRPCAETWSSQEDLKPPISTMPVPTRMVSWPMQPHKSSSGLTDRANMVETPTCKTHTRTRQCQQLQWPTRRTTHHWCLRSSGARCDRPEAMYRTRSRPRLSLWACQATRFSNSTLILGAKARWFPLRRLTTSTKLGRNRCYPRWLVSSNPDKAHQARLLSS